MKQKAKVYPNPSNPTAHGRLITPSRQEEATALMDGYRKNGVESNRQMISERYDQSKSSSTHGQPKDGEEERGDGKQMPTAVKSAATPASKLDSRRGDMWHMFANEIAKDISGQLDRLIESMHTDPKLGDVEKSALVADVEKFRKASQAYRYKKFYQPAKEMRSEYQGLTIVQSYQCQIAETDWGVEFHEAFILGRLNPALEKELKKRTSDVLAAKNKVLEVHDSDDESSGGGSEMSIDMTTAFTVLNPEGVLSNVETLVDECIANLEGNWAQTLCYWLAALFHYLAFNNGVRPDSTAKPADSNGSVATKLVSIEVGDGGTIEHPVSGRTARNGHQKRNQCSRVALERLFPGVDKPIFLLDKKRVDLTSDTPLVSAPSTARPSLAGWVFLVLAGACQIGTAWAGLRLNSFTQNLVFEIRLRSPTPHTIRPPPPRLLGLRLRRTSHRVVEMACSASTPGTCK